MRAGPTIPDATCGTAGGAAECSPNIISVSASRACHFTRYRLVRSNRTKLARNRLARKYRFARRLHAWPAQAPAKVTRAVAVTLMMKSVNQAIIVGLAVCAFSTISAASKTRLCVVQPGDHRPPIAGCTLAKTKKVQVKGRAVAAKKQQKGNAVAEKKQTRMRATRFGYVSGRSLYRRNQISLPGDTTVPPPTPKGLGPRPNN